MKEYDVFIIGSGMAGMTIANKCAAQGLSVGITDELPYGGTCALRGCDPKKVLIGATEALDHAKRLQGKGLEGVPSINWHDLMTFKKSFTEPMPSKIEKGYKKNGIEMFHSSAKFAGENQLIVGGYTIKADKIVIATGAKPRTLGIPGGEHALTSTDFLNLSHLPRSLVFVGGGYIAFEFAHIAAGCGADVIIVHRGTSPLENFEQDIVKHLVSATEDLGIQIVLNTEVTGITKENDGNYQVRGKGKDGDKDFSAAAVFNSAGRMPAIFDLDLLKANVKFSKKGVDVNEYLQSITNKHVYAAGDAAHTNGLPLTPVAVMEGHILASNLIKGNYKSFNDQAMPTVVFTIPSMASVGLTEKEAASKNLEYRVNYQTVPTWFNAKRLNEKHYAFKTLIDKGTDKILGAHLIGPEAEETINLFAMAMNAGLKTSQLKSMVFSYPTLASDISHIV